jgi:membrane protease YdiL (CAAX protease family)
MAEFSSPASEAIQTNLAALSYESPRLRLFELCLVVLIAFGGSIILSLYLLIHPPGGPSQVSSSRWAVGIFQQVMSLALLAYVLHRRRLGLKDLGLRWSWRDLGTGLLLAIVGYIFFRFAYFLIVLIHHSLFQAGLKVLDGKAFYNHPSAIAIPAFLINPFFEEMIVRAYLMTEIEDLTKSKTLAIILSVFIQASYHLYYGWVGATTVAVQFLVYAIYYSATKKILPVIVAHEVYDLYYLVRLW